MSGKSINNVIKKDIESNHRSYTSKFNNIKIDKQNISYDEVEEYSDRFESHNKFNSYNHMESNQESKNSFTFKSITPKDIINDRNTNDMDVDKLGNS